MKKDIIKTVQTNVETVVDSETGEVIDINVHKTKVIADPNEFALIYVGFWDVLMGNPLSKSDIELFAYLVQSYANGTSFVITRYLKDQVALRSGKSSTTYDRSVAVLLEHKLIYRVEGRRTYQINPRYAYKGHSHDRNKLLVEVVESGCKDC